MPKPIYLDHNATTPLMPEVVEAMLPYLKEHFGNPSSGHLYGQRARKAVERARQQVATLIACQPEEIVFTSGGTEANNLAIRGVAGSSPRRGIVTSVVEHPATAQPCTYLERHGWEVVRVPVDAHARVLADSVRSSLGANTALVTVMLAQNETGTLMPVAEIASAAHEYGALAHTDAAQAIGKIPVLVDDLGVDLLSIAGHKLYAPKGVGALYVRKGTALAPFVLGAGHEGGLRPGTENVAGIVGLGAACELARGSLRGEAARERELRDELFARLSADVPGVRLNGHPRERLPNTLNVSFPGARGSAVLAAAPDIAASTGSACHEGAEMPSAVLLAIGLEPAEALTAVRLSIGRSTTRDDVARAARALIKAYRAVTSSRSRV